MNTQLMPVPSATNEAEGSGEALDLVSPSALEVMERAQIDVQISTAHRFPRSMTTFLKRGQAMVSIDEETATSCIYRRPVGKEGNRTVFAEGESVRMAEIVAACFGNLRAQARIIDQTERKVTALGFAHDLETNYAVQVEVVEATVKKNGAPYDERMRLVIAKAALSKAFRDAVFRVVPKSLCKPLSNLARQVAVGDVKSLDSRRQRVLDWINKAGAEPARVFATLGVNGIEEITLDHLATLTGLKTAILDKELSIDDAFPPLQRRAEFSAPATRPPALDQPAAPAAETVARPEAAPVERGNEAAPKVEAAAQDLPPRDAARPTTEKEIKLMRMRERFDQEGIKEEQFVAHLRKLEVLEANKGLDQISLPRLNQFIDRVGDIAAEIRNRSELPLA